MLPIAYYFLQVILCTALMMGYYWLVLRNKRFHQYNRFYLLAITVLAWIVPLIKIKWGHAAVNNDPLQFLSVVADSNSEIESFTRKGFHWDWEVFAGVTYFVVAGILLIGMIRAFSKLYQLLKTHSCKSVGDVYLILTQAQGTPFSFFRYIFWNEEIDIRSESGKQILQHELTHVQQKHSFDKLLIQVVLIVGWFNPFFWLIKKELEMIHEFIADRKAVHNGDTSSLAQMLLTAAYPQQQFMLTNPFFFSPIKRRLQMLTNNQNPRFSYIRRLVVLPLLGMVVVLFAFRNKEEKQMTLSVATVVEKAVEKGRQMIAVEDIPLKPLAKKDTVIIQADTVYILGKDKNDVVKIVPVSAKPNILGNPVYILDGVKIDSSVFKTIDPNQIQSVDVLKNGTAIALYGEDAKNGVVIIKTKSNAPSYGATVTVTPHSDPDKPTTLYGRRDKEGNWMMPLSGKRFVGSAKSYRTPVSVNNMIKENVLIILDGEKVNQKIFETLDPVSISSVNVLKDSSARILYGEEGKDGVIVITTKANADEYNKKNPRKPAYEGYPLFTQSQVPAEFPGGLVAWSKYLERNLDLNVIKRNGGPAGKYTVELTFIVDKSGNISDITAENDPGYGTKEEAIRMIEKGPRWKPAVQNGETVTYRHKQSITFFLSDTGEKKENQPAASQKSNPVKLNAFSPAEFPGGEPAWQKYLQRNLNRDLIVEKGGPPGKYSVLVEFVVSKNGEISNVKAMSDPGYGTKEEAVKMIESGPRWKPAVENAVNIDTRSSKKITWLVSGEKVSTNNKQLSKIVEKKQTPDEEISFRVMAAKAASQNDNIFYMIDGRPSLLWDATGVNWSRIDGTNDFAIIVDGKKISSDKLNSSYKRTDFKTILTRNSIKYGKMVFFLSTKPVTPEEINHYLN